MFPAAVVHSFWVWLAAVSPGQLAVVMTSTDPPARPAGSPRSRSARSSRTRRAGPLPAGSRPAGAAAALGRYGEALAVRYLRELGMEVLDRNWRCEHGEVDVVARDGDCIVICEVKTRRAAGFGEPVEAVTFAKAMRLRRLAAAYVKGPGAGGHAAQVRVDVVGILCRPGRPAVVRHVVGVGS